MKMEGSDPRCRVTIGPYWARSWRRTGSKEEKLLEDLRSHKKFPRTGKVGGPGGNFLFLWERSRNDRRKTNRQRNAISNNQNSIGAVN
jgi:hypothetical protein